MQSCTVPFLSVAETFSGEVISIVYQLELPAVHSHHCSNVQHFYSDLIIAAALQERFAVLDVVLQHNARFNMAAGGVKSLNSSSFVISHHLNLLGLWKVQQLILPCDAGIAIEPLHNEGISLSKQPSLGRAFMFVKLAFP